MYIEYIAYTASAETEQFVIDTVNEVRKEEKKD